MSLRSRVRYRFDNLLARGTWAALLWLGVITLLAVLVSSVLLSIFSVTFAGSGNGSWLEDFWQSLLRVLDTGTMAGDVGWGRRLLALMVTTVGILIAGTLIGLIASGVERRVEDMQLGRSSVIESGHVVVLGASSGLPLALEQLALAGQATGLGSIVVLAPSESVSSTSELRAAVGDLHRTRLVVRRGESTRLADLDMVAITQARAVVVLAEDDATNDAHVVNTVLAVDAARDGCARIPVAAEVQDVATALRLVEACGDHVHPLVAAQSAGRVAAFALREPGLNQLIRELLDVGGVDLSLRSPGSLEGMTFGQAVVSTENARPIGRIRANGEIEIKPSPATRLDAEDRVILLAQDDAEMLVADHDDRASDAASVTGSVVSTSTTSFVDRPDPGLFAQPRRERALFVGWNGLGAHLLDRLASASAPGSTAEIFYDPRLVDAATLPDGRPGTVSLHETDDVHAAWQLVRTRAGEHPTSVVLLASSIEDAEAADSETLLLLKTLRASFDDWDGAAPRVVVQLRDPQSVDLAPVVHADDYVISSEIGSRLIAQLAMQPERRAILLHLDGTAGASFHLVDATALGVTGTIPFRDVVISAYEQGVIALGWRSADGADLVLNPGLSADIDVGAGTKIVVVG